MQERLKRIRMVMVNTTHPGNIGAAARAIKNMGLSSLVLVDPKEFPSPKAVWRAAGAVDVLENVKVVSTLDEAISGCGLVVGTSARERRIPWPLLTPRECGDRVCVESQEHDIAILFGREDRGLTNEELQKCNYHVHIPANADYSSLNIAAAMQVIAYEIRMSFLNQEAGQAITFDDWDMPPAKQQDLEMYYTHLEETLAKLGFYDPKNPRQTMTRMRRLYSRVRMDEMELSIMRGMLTSIQNYIYRTNQKTDSSDEETQ
ncbi:tRNA (cytosine(32)/uridine(32)-2'-O)-methyltransferase TrmJ [Agarilytica rhodophyticola]|uniref:tRNA (cytosine(32)/uridine(32)-2'-O)-methyltransferase TrmJ n=1 Tax=Agarilytica rhodophyticola TaxID=1737490 RepID=UPI000B341FC9|nr:tRNA (cytosine(32)/uridine(32)-2'-O)-methyltransferase TrmJ [Agarilytica rhodophyticola]